MRPEQPAERRRTREADFQAGIQHPRSGCDQLAGAVQAQGGDIGVRCLLESLGETPVKMELGYPSRPRHRFQRKRSGRLRMNVFPPKQQAAKQLLPRGCPHGRNPYGLLANLLVEVQQLFRQQEKVLLKSAGRKFSPATLGQTLDASDQGPLTVTV